MNAGRAAHGTRRTSKPQQRRDDDRERKPGNALHGVYEPATSTIYASHAPSTAAGIGALLDAILHMDRSWHHHAEVSLPLYPNARTQIIGNLQVIAAGGRASLIGIGTFTEPQFNDINAVRRGLGLHAIESREIVFIGRHIYVSRSKDGYTIDDMMLQIESALSAASVVFANPKMTAMNNPHPRADGYGNRVYDRAIFECTQRKPRAELFSVIPKGDDQKPQTKKARPSASLSEDDPG